MCAARSLKLTFVIAAIGPGGAERMMSQLANYLSKQGHQISLITLDPSTPDRYELAPEVKRLSINIFWESRSRIHSLVSTFKRLLIIRRAIRSTRPDLVLSFIDMTNIRVLASMIFTKVPVVVSERIDPTMHNIGAAWDRLRNRIYPLAAQLVVQTEAVANWATSVTHISRISVIPNFVRQVESDLPRPRVMPDGQTIIAAGRLAEQKGFDLLITAFARSDLPGKNWSLVILGEGSERPALEKQIRQLGLQASILLPGNMSDIDAWFCHADIFVLSSRYEGFPNVLMEAMACGLPAIAFDCKSGPSEIIKNGINGILVPSEDIQAMARALIYLDNNPDKAMSLSIEAKKIINKYSARRITRTWIDLFQQVIAQAGMK